MPHTLWTWAGAGPTTELSSQTVVPEPGGPSPSRTERELNTADLGRRGTHRTELSSQAVTDPEPGGAYPSRTKREPTCPTRCGPEPEPDPRLSCGSGAGRAESESDGAGAH